MFARNPSNTRGAAQGTTPTSNQCRLEPHRMHCWEGWSVQLSQLEATERSTEAPGWLHLNSSSILSFCNWKREMMNESLTRRNISFQSLKQHCIRWMGHSNDENVNLSKALQRRLNFCPGLDWSCQSDTHLFLDALVLGWQSDLPDSGTLHSDASVRFFLRKKSSKCMFLPVKLPFRSQLERQRNSELCQSDTKVQKCRLSFCSFSAPKGNCHSDGRTTMLIGCKTNHSSKSLQCTLLSIWCTALQSPHKQHATGNTISSAEVQQFWFELSTLGLSSQCTGLPLHFSSSSFKPQSFAWKERWTRLDAVRKESRECGEFFV